MRSNTKHILTKHTCTIEISFSVKLYNTCEERKKEPVELEGRRERERERERERGGGGGGGQEKKVSIY